MSDFTFIWRIDNFRSCALLHQECLTSPSFFVEVLDKTQWHLKVYPRGFSNELYISCYLCRAEDDGPAYVPVHFELSVKKTDGILNKKSSCYSFSRNVNFGFADFLLRDKFVQDTESYLQNGSLTIYCHMERSFTNELFLRQCSARTHIEVQRYSFHWNIDMTDSHEENWKQTISVTKVHDLPSLHISLCFCDLPVDDPDVAITILKVNNDEKTHLFLTCKISLLDGDGHHYKLKDGEHLFQTSDKEVWRFPNFLQRSDLCGDLSVLSVRSLYCELAMSGDRETSERVENTFSDYFSSVRL